MSDLFSHNQPVPVPSGKNIPLAEQLRPKSIEEVIGQDHLVGVDAPLSRMIRSQHLSSLILWGPPGSGKTSIARLLCEGSDLTFEAISAIFSGVADLKKIFESARHRRMLGRGTLLFVDEIHRFNRAQQDSFLPVVEDGTIVLVGATTENPSFELNAALLSRCQVLVLHRLDDQSLERLLAKAETLRAKALPINEPAREQLIRMADGDGRFLLNMAEQLLTLPDEVESLTPDQLSQFLSRRLPLYDKAQDGHFNLISALHKSCRGSDPDAALYYLARMLEAGEDPLYIVRRLVRFASEDIGLADPQALVQCLAAKDSYELLGTPEGELAIAQAVVYCATAPKSNALYKAYKAARQAAREHGSLMPPMRILNAPSQLMDQLGYGQGYIYDHDTEEGFSGQNYFPDGMVRGHYYEPVARGFERDIQKRLDYWQKLRQQKLGKN